jgi:hypothetical protein
MTTDALIVLGTLAAATSFGDHGRLAACTACSASLIPLPWGLSLSMTLR